MSVFGFDFGNHSSYVAIVRGGGFDTVDDEFSYRATPTFVSFTDQMRLCGNSARSKAVANFRNTFSHFKNLIGLSYDDPVAQEEMRRVNGRFVKLSDGTIGVEASYLGQNTQYSIVQLVAMMLSCLRTTALRHSSTISSCVINTPIYFTDSQHRALLDACKIAGLKPVSIISDCAAVCFNYVLFKTDLPTDIKKPRNVFFVNIGYSSTQICIASFTKDKFKILASASTMEVAGRGFDMVLFNKFCDEFATRHSRDVREHAKAVQKLLTQCEIVKKQINTTSAELPVRIECFLDDIDLVSKASRDEFDTLSSTLYTALKNILEEALTQSGLKLKDIHSVELVGGSTRLSGVKEIINSFFNMPLSTTLNSDEAVCRGSAIHAASLSPVVKMRAINAQDHFCSKFTLQFLNKKGVSKNVELFKIGTLIPVSKKVTLFPMNDFNFEVIETPLKGLPKSVLRARSFGKTAEECQAENLIFSVDINQFGCFSVSHAAFTQSVSIEEPIENGNSSDKKEKTKQLNHDLMLEIFYSEYSSDHLEQSIKIEKDMEHQIKLERERETAKNNLEEYIYSVREKIEPIYRSYMTDQEVNELQLALTNEENWLYSAGESQTVDVYNDHLSSLQSVFQPVYARSEGFSKSFSTLNELSISIFKYRKLIDMFNEDPSKYEHVTSEEFQKYNEKITQMDLFVSESTYKLNNQPKTKLPSVSYLDVEQKNNELRAFCDPILNKAQSNPPKIELPKPDPPKSQPQNETTQQTNDSATQMDVDPNPSCDECK